MDQPNDFTTEIGSGADIGAAMDALKEWLELGGDEVGQVRIIDTATGAVLADVAVSVAGGKYELAWEGLRDLVREEARIYYGLEERRGGRSRTP